jgi:hypothetical protein
MTLDDGKGVRHTVISGTICAERDRFCVPLQSAGIELWHDDERIAATSSDLKGEYAFVASIPDGDYTLRPLTCPASETRLTIQHDRNLHSDLSCSR